MNEIWMGKINLKLFFDKLVFAQKKNRNIIWGKTLRQIILAEMIILNR